MDVQQAVLSKALHDEAMLALVNARITPVFFTDDRYQRIYVWMQNYWAKYSTSPNLAVVQTAYPAYTWPTYAEPIAYFIDALRERRAKALLTDALTKSATLLTDDEPGVVTDILGVIDEMRLAVRLETAPTLDRDYVEGGADAMDLLFERQDNPGYLRGISTGFNGIDYVTGGFQPEQFIVLIGLPKSMKSSTLLKMAMECHAQAKVPLFVGFEMSNEEQQDRLMSLYGNVGLSRVITGTLGHIEADRIAQSFKRLKGMRRFILSVDMESATTVAGIQGKILEYSPDVVFIDGAYMMQSELPKAEPGSAAALTDIARGLKRLAQAMRIPIVVTTQASSTRAKGGKLSMFSAMYTQAWGQSADVMLGVERTDYETNGDQSGPVQILLKVLTSRSGPRTETTLVWDWAQGEVTEMTPAMFKKGAEDGDDDDD